MIPTDALAEIQTVFERCQQRYPTVDLPFAGFLARIEEIVAELAPDAVGEKSQDFRSWLAKFELLHHEDLFLALACARGNRIAWEHFVDDFLSIVQRCAAQACGGAPDSEDVAQEIVVGLLGSALSDSQRDKAVQIPSRLSQYSGRGTLSGWLRISVAHAAVDRFRRRKRQVSIDEIEAEGKTPSELTDRKSGEGAESALDARWGPVLSRLLEEELQRLPPRDRMLLSLYYVREVPLRVIGEQFHVHEATASRWLEGLRNNLRKRVERQLRIRHGLRAKDIRGLWRWVSESPEWSVEQILVK